MQEISTKAFERFRAVIPDKDATPMELLDILWLGSRLEEEAARERAPVERGPGEEPAEWKTEVEREDMEVKRRPDDPPPAPSPEVIRSSAQLKGKAGLHPRIDRKPGDATMVPAAPVRAPGVVGLPGSLEIARALRPLMKRVPSRHAMVFDETATAERRAESGIFDAVLRATSARWLDLAVVVDRSGAMELWDKSLGELYDLLERHRAFRNVRAWTMNHDDGNLTFHTLSRQPRQIKPAELSDPTGTQLVVVVSDCVSRPWTTTQVPKIMEHWSRCGPVAIVQVMPERLWGSTALRFARETIVRSNAAGAPNRYVQDVSDTYDAELARDTVTVPVTALDPVSLERWAQFIAANGGATARAYAFRTTETEEEREERELRMQDAPEGGYERVKRFDRIATEDAKRLSRVLAAAEFPLTPPVLRLVQDAVLPGTPRSAIAEVVLGGLMKVTNRAAESERTEYEFVSAEVTEHLVDRVSTTDVLRLTDAIDTWLAEHLSNIIDFPAVVPVATGTGALSIAAKEVPFARLGQEILARLGVSAPLVTEPTRRRRELLAYLAARPEDSDEARALATWIRGLRRFGIPILIEAALVAAEEKRGRIPILKKVREIVQKRSREEALALAASIEAAEKAADKERRQRDVATLAADAAVIAFRSEDRVADATELAVLTAVHAALGPGTSVQQLRNAVAKRLSDSVAADPDLLPDEVPDRGRVIVVGPVRYVLPKGVEQAARQVGQKLAASGFHLVVGGWGGVDYLVTRAFVREVELRGEEVEKRVSQFAEPNQVPNYRGLPWRSAASWVDAVVPEAAAVVVVGAPDIPILIREAARRNLPVVPLRWTGTSARRGPRGGRFLAEPGIESDADAHLMTDRAMAAAVTLTDPALRARWIDYTTLLHAMVGDGRQSQTFEPSAPRLAAFLGSLEADLAMPPQPVAAAPEEWGEQLMQAAEALRDWVIFDTLALSEVEREWNPDRDVLLRQMTGVAQAAAPERIQAWLERRWREIRNLVPHRPIDGLLPIAQTIFPDPEQFSAWSHGFAGVSPAECEFRMSIPYDVYRAAVSYASRRTDDVKPQLDLILDGLFRARLDPPYEFVSKYADADEGAARTLAYVLMQMNKYAIAATELARRLSDETARALRDADARPLRQLLLAIGASSASFDLPSLRIVARALSAAASEIPTSSFSYDAPQAAEQIAGILALRPFRAAAASNEKIDGLIAEARRSRHPLFLPAELRREGMRGDEIEFLFRNGTAGQRLVALKLAAATADASSFETLRSALHAPSSAAEYGLALRAAESISPRLAHDQLSVLTDLVLRGPFDPSAAVRTAEAEAVAVHLAAQRDAADRVRHAPIAVIGSSRGVDLREFCRFLGISLATRDLGVLIANPDMAVWLAEGYRTRKPELNGFVVLRSADDRRPLRKGLPYRHVDGDVRALREQMMSQARGAIVIGGRTGTYDEYAIARRRGIPVVPVGPSRGAAAGVAKTAIVRLNDDGLSRTLLRSLTRSGLTPALAAAVCEAMAWAIVVEEAQRATILGDQERAASMSTEALAVELRSRLHARDAVRIDEAVLLTVTAATPKTWNSDPVALNGARRYSKRVQRLTFAYTGNPYVAELIARCELALCILEAMALVSTEADRRIVQSAGDAQRFAAVPVAALERLAELIRNGRSIPGARRAAMVARINEEIERLRRI